MDRRDDRRNDDRGHQRSSAGRVPPHNLQAEESVLGALLLSRDAIGVVGEAGLKVRDPRDVDWQPEDTPARKAAFQAEEHPTVAPPPRKFPDDTEWKDSRGLRGWARWIVGIAIAALLVSLMGDLLHTGSRPGSCHVHDWMASLGGSDLARACFAQWQLAWWHAGTKGILDFFTFRSPGWAILWDFFFILAYGYVLAWPMAWAFARRAGLRRASMTPPRALNVLGRSLKYAVIGDVVENLATLAVIGLAGSGWFYAALGMGIVMSVAAVVKFLGLAGVLVLILWGFVSKAPDA